MGTTVQPVNKPAEPAGLTMDQGVSELSKWLSDTEESPSGAERAQEKPTTDPAADEARRKRDEGDSEAEAAKKLEALDGEADDEELAPEEEEEAPLEDEEEELPPPKMVRVPKGEDGSEWELVPEQEAKNRYLLRQQHTKATQQLAEDRRAAAAEKEEAAKVREDYAGAVAQLHEALKAQAPKEPDWNLLRDNDPDLFARTWAAHQLQQRGIAEAAAERDRAVVEVNKDRAVKMQEYMQGERRSLLEKIPTWADAAVQKEEFPKILAYLKDSEGFTDDELNSFASHKVIVAARKAYLYDQMQKNKPVTKNLIRQKQAAVKTVEPGPAASSRRTVSRDQRTFNELKRTGDARAGAKLIESLI